MFSEILWLIFGIIIGLVGGFFAARFYMQYELKKNPPLNETVIREMMSQMGRKPSQQQVQAVLRASQKANATTRKR